MGSVPTTDRDQIVRFHQRLIEKMLEDEEVVVAMSGEPCELGILLSEPEIRLRLEVNGVNSRLYEVDGGDIKVDNPRILMKWSTAYRFWQGTLDLMSAVLNGSVRIEGTDMDPLFQLKSIAHKAQDASRVIADEMGWD